MSSSLVRRSSALDRLKADRATGNALATLHTDALLQRAADEAQCSLARAKMSDMGRATRHGLDEGDLIVGELEDRLANRPLGANALCGIAEDGIKGVRRALRSLTGDF